MSFAGKNKGFTLVEMAIVLIVVGLVISTIATVLPSLLSSAKIKKSQAILEKFDYSLNGYFAANGRLPCPDTDNDGLENRNDGGTAGDPSDDSCSAYSGTVPYFTLGLSDGNDAWTNPVKYGVYEDLIRSTADSGSNPACTVLATIIDYYDPSGGNNLPDTAKAYSTDPAGTNGNKGYILASGGSKDLDGNGDGFFDGYNEGNDVQFDHPNRIADHTTSGSEYDDLVTIVSFSYLHGKTCSGGSGSGGTSSAGTVITESDCGNSVDDDSDGWVDCADQDCNTDPLCAGNTAVQINESAMPSTILDNTYSYTYQATGGNGTYYWYLVSSEVSGLTINLLTGTISGTINVCSGEYDIVVKAADRTDAANFDTHTFQLTVDNGVLAITPTYETGDISALQTFVCNSSAFDRVLAASGPNLGGFDWSVDWSSPQPSGFVLSETSDTETELSKTGSVTTGANTYTASFTATDASCPDNSVQLSMQVEVTAAGASAPYSDGIVGEWLFDECLWDGTAGQVLDSGPSASYHGTAMSSAVTSGAGKECRGGAFNGSNYVTIPNSPELEVGSGDGDFTVAFWFNLTTGFTGSWRSITHKGNSDSERTFAMWMRPSDNRIHYRISTASNSNGGGDSQGAVVPLTWTHVVYLKEDRQLKLYLNGVLDSTASLVGAVRSNDGPIYIGKDPWFAGVKAMIDEYMIWDKALTEDEISDIYALSRSTCSGDCYTDPVAQYSMELDYPWAGAAGEVKDSAGSTEENGVAAKRGTGAIPSQTGPSAGKICRSAVFDNINGSNGGYLDLGDPDALDPASSAWSITAWFNWDGSSGENIIYNKENLYEARVQSGVVNYAWQPHWNWDGGSSFSVNPNTWYHMAVVYDGMRQSLYKDGQEVYARAQSGSMGTTGNKLLLGARGSGSPVNFFGGMLDEIRFYNRALAANELAWMISETSSCQDDFPVITTVSFPDGILGQSYSATPSASGGGLPYNWQLVSGEIPGLVISNHASGELTGTLDRCSGDYLEEVKVTDNNNVSDIKFLPLRINNGTLALSPSSVTIDCTSADCSQDFTVSGPAIGAMSNWSIVWQGGADPGGFTVSSTGAGSCRFHKNGPSTAGANYGFRLTAQDASCADNTLSLPASSWYILNISGNGVDAP